MKSTLLATFLAAGLAFGGLSSAVSAQDKTGAPDSHLKAAEELVVSIGNLPPYDAQIKLIKKNAKMWLTRQNPALDKLISETVEEQSKILDGKDELLIRSVATVWASYFSEEEIKELQAFFKTEVGQKMGAYQARIIGETIGSVQKTSQALTAGLVNSVKEELTKKGHKF